LIAHCPSSEQDQRRAHAFATAVDDVFGHLTNQDDVGVKAVADDRINGLHVRPDQGVKLFQCHGREFFE